MPGDRITGVPCYADGVEPLQPPWPNYYPDSGIDDKNWRRILAVGEAGATKDARLVAPELEERRRKRPRPERTTPPTGKRTAERVFYPTVRVVKDP